LLYQGTVEGISSVLIEFFILEEARFYCKRR